MIITAGCRSFYGVTYGVEFRIWDLPEQGARLAVPAHWKVQEGDFFQLSSEGDLDEYKHLSFEYRGLPMPEELVSMSQKKTYAYGWYDAFLVSYRNKQGVLLDKSQNEVEPEGTFQLIGQYEDEKLGTMIKFGLLHFRKGRLHALYYVAPKKGFEEIFDLFRAMESRHQFYAPQ
ncbi:MAG: hypothetical protein KDK39_00230 [Leptospiraceae bacterium]|nr:hypothetical protein [Leptospiraceae bacterium]